MIHSAYPTALSSVRARIERNGTSVVRVSPDTRAVLHKAVFLSPHLTVICVTGQAISYSTIAVDAWLSVTVYSITRTVSQLNFCFLTAVQIVV
jgi:hypothetical protein